MFRVLIPTTCAALLAALAASADPPCRGAGDLSGEGRVDAADLPIFAACMGGPDIAEPPPGGDPNAFALADLSGDGDVDLHDFGVLMRQVGGQYFAYGPHRQNLEAEMLAMTVANMLRAPDAEYERILRDLALIRAAYPQLVTVIDDTDYMPTELLVGIDAGQPLDQYYALNEFYLVQSEEIHYSFRLLTFCDSLNLPLLAPIYEALAAVTWADPNWLIGIDDYITIDVIGATYRYNIDDGFWDCFDGCDCHRYWVIDVDQAGNVTLISYREYGMPWCQFGQ